VVIEAQHRNGTAAEDASSVVGWDVGGAHLKACLLRGGLVADVAEWACPLWQGLDQLDRALDQAAARWPALAGSRHAITMTGEMVDHFENREDGVCRIAARMALRLGAAARIFAGDAGWCSAGQVPARWPQIASANWLATAMQVAGSIDEGVLVDIGSTTTDLIAFKRGRVCGSSRSDAQRLASGELVYHGVVRTPLCAIAPRIELRGIACNVMNEWFATSADVYRLTGELNPAHDLHPSADGAAKDLPATRQRLARMVGLDARDASPADWLANARAWRAAQLDDIGGQLQRVCSAHRIPATAPLVSAGCGDFLVDALAAASGRPCLHFGRQVARLSPEAPAATADWAQVCAPSVAVAVLLAMEPR